MALVAATAALTASTADAGPSTPAAQNFASVGASPNVDYTMYAAPVGDTYVVGHISGSDQVWAYECVSGWRHIRTASGRGGDHYGNTVAWVYLGC
ncbi:hypothetical protein [Kutzneria chonburiensis]|uniref:SH3 domain-containing protein n=1 Tax=Kutzneria chonburiensis TaxID=1483604 RepID=A0ABV6MZ89_9PSEU|nr:hypothetical protein [Kutzneria chonburiensis]